MFAVFVTARWIGAGAEPAAADVATTLRTLARGSAVAVLGHSFGGKVGIEVARQLGHSPTICLRDYAQVFDEHDPADRKPAVQVIAEARSAAALFALGSHDQGAESA